MIKLDAFVVSKRPYAVKLDSMRSHFSGGWPVFDAVWFRRRRGVYVACVGTLALHDVKRYGLAAPVQCLSLAVEGHYGGDCRTRVSESGESWTATQNHALYEADRQLALSMLRFVGVVPGGFDGWWSFDRS